MSQQALAFATGPAIQAKQQSQRQGHQQGQFQAQQQTNSNRKSKDGQGKWKEYKAWQASQKLMWAQFSNTKMCKYMVNGTCTKGAQCNFAHDKTVIQALPDLSRTKLCKTFFKSGVCDNPGCTYAHSQEELRGTSDFGIHKTKLCRFWPNGTCELGDKCRFAHTSTELRPGVADHKAMQQQWQQQTGELQPSDDHQMELDTNGRLVLNREMQGGQDFAVSRAASAGHFTASSQFGQLDQLQASGGYLPPAESTMPQYPPSNQEPQIQHQLQQPRHQQKQRPQRQQQQQQLQRKNRAVQNRALPKMVPAGGLRHDMKSGAHDNQVTHITPLQVALPQRASDEDPDGFGDSDYDPTADFGSVHTGGSGESGENTPPKMWSNSCSDNVEGRAANEQWSEFKEEEWKNLSSQDDMGNWTTHTMSGTQGQTQSNQMQGQPMGMLFIPGQGMVPVWAALPPTESGDGATSQSCSGGQMIGNNYSSSQQNQYGNSSTQAMPMAVPYGWQPMMVMAQPNNMPSQYPNRNSETMAGMSYTGSGQAMQPVAQCEDGSGQVKSTFLPCSPDSAQMYQLLQDSVHGSGFESQDWMGG